MTCVIDFGGTSLCRTEALIESEIPYQINRISEGAQMNYSKTST